MLYDALLVLLLLLLPLLLLPLLLVRPATGTTLLATAYRLLYVSRSFFTFSSSPRIVAISPCMNAHGIVELARGHFSPLGQYTSAPEPCRLMLSRLQGKQNL